MMEIVLNPSDYFCFAVINVKPMSLWLITGRNMRHMSLKVVGPRLKWWDPIRTRDRLTFCGVRFVTKYLDATCEERDAAAGLPLPLRWPINKQPREN